jgi:hypothetical protein
MRAPLHWTASGPPARTYATGLVIDPAYAASHTVLRDRDSHFRPPPARARYRATNFGITSAEILRYCSNMIASGVPMGNERLTTSTPG